MGTSAAYYCIWNLGFTEKELKEKLRTLSSAGREKEETFYKSLSALLSPEIVEQMRRETAETAAHFETIFPGMIQPQRKGAVIAYRLEAQWLPLFETALCEGYTASSKDAMRLSKLFQAPVLAFSLFDSDVLFVSYGDAEKEICYDYAKPNFEEFEEYDVERYSTGFPDFLTEFCSKTELKAIWNRADEVFADDRLEKLCRLMQIDLLYDGACVLEGYQLISVP